MKPFLSLSCLLPDSINEMLVIAVDRIVSSQNIHPYEPQNVTLLEIKIFADAIKMRSSWIREGSKCNDGCLYETEK